MRVVVRKQTQRVLIRDAEILYRDAEKEIDSSIRDSAEKAWGAMTQAIDALILEKLEFDPEGKAAWRQRQEALNRLEPIPEMRPIVRAYHEKADVLHGNCFYEGICEPKQVVQDQIREVNRYIEDIRKLIGA